MKGRRQERQNGREKMEEERTVEVEKERSEKGDRRNRVSLRRKITSRITG